ncbi:head-tail connector protein [Mesorhizobium sp. BR1-1-3]|uniref:head-tail connector protein n=1 Tax=Mesorhizobium sp. BR1-1-3 TaxID=2876651 RepID=UPI001CD0D2A0|nr:head-tail connector protein [Mesorhizobium sp. BR1-1-3]MBZ9888120.1 head-tail connector protein [Mesorhizobium sp. BR1-1-3]
MWLQPTVTIAATSEPVSLVEAKRQVRVDFDDDDQNLTDLIATARNHAEKYCGVYLAQQTVAVQADDWCDLTHLPIRPAQSIASLAYVDAAGATQTLATTVYELRGDTVVLKYGQVWPSIRKDSLITLTAVVGFAEVEPAVKHAILLRIADLYETRESAGEANWTSFDSLLSNHRFY